MVRLGSVALDSVVPKKLACSVKLIINLEIGLVERSYQALIPLHELSTGHPRHIATTLWPATTDCADGAADS